MRALVTMLIAGAFGVVLAPAPGMARVAIIRIIPPQPTVLDSVRVEVSDNFGMGCWRDMSQDCWTDTSDTLSMTVVVQYCGGAPACICTAEPYVYNRVCRFGLLGAGTYTVSFSELHPNVYDPVVTFTQGAQFVVSNVPTPTRGTSWGRIKTIYR